MGSVGEAGIARGCDPVAGFDPLSDANAAATLLQMAIVAQRPITVPDRDVVIELIEIQPRAASVRIVLYADHHAGARGAHRRSLGHLPVHSVLVRALMAELAVVTLAHGE